MGKVDVVCAGILVTDIFSSILPELPKPGQLILVDDIYLSTGGCASNTAVSLSKLGVKSGAVGKIGKDLFGDFIVNYLKEKGVDTSGISRSSDKATSKTIVLLTFNEDRRFIHNFGANADFGLEDIDFDYISQTKALYIGGYLDLPRLNQASVIKLLKFAREKGVITFLDVVVAHPHPELINECKNAFPYVNYFLPNRDEAKILTGEDDPRAQAETFLKYNPEMTVVITMGKEGSLVRTKEKIIQAKSYSVKVVDPSGGGDAFDAGFIFGVLENWELEETLKFASALGASAVTAIGCTPGVFTKDEALKFIRENKLEMEVIRASL
ncbi:sugar kinase [Candidatus Aerophobetes bacterium]|nr:sugar kinase [Candidatus Aerophobetes bacterium]